MARRTLALAAIAIPLLSGCAPSSPAYLLRSWDMIAAECRGYGKDERACRRRWGCGDDWSRESCVVAVNRLYWTFGR